MKRQPRSRRRQRSPMFYVLACVLVLIVCAALVFFIISIQSSDQPTPNDNTMIDTSLISSTPKPPPELMQALGISFNAPGAVNSFPTQVPSAACISPPNEPLDPGDQQLLDEARDNSNTLRSERFRLTGEIQLMTDFEYAFLQIRDGQGGFAGFDTLDNPSAQVDVSLIFGMNGESESIDINVRWVDWFIYMRAVSESVGRESLWLAYSLDEMTESVTAFDSNVAAESGMMDLSEMSNMELSDIPGLLALTELEDFITTWRQSSPNESNAHFLTYYDINGMVAGPVLINLLNAMMKMEDAEAEAATPAFDPAIAPMLSESFHRVVPYIQFCTATTVALPATLVTHETIDLEMTLDLVQLGLPEFQDYPKVNIRGHFDLTLYNQNDPLSVVPPSDFEKLSPFEPIPTDVFVERDA